MYVQLWQYLEVYLESLCVSRDVFKYSVGRLGKYIGHHLERSTCTCTPVASDQGNNWSHRLSQHWLEWFSISCCCKCWWPPSASRLRKWLENLEVTSWCCVFSWNCCSESHKLWAHPCNGQVFQDLNENLRGAKPHSYETKEKIFFGWMANAQFRMTPGLLSWKETNNFMRMVIRFSGSYQKHFG